MLAGADLKALDKVLRRTQEVDAEDLAVALSPGASCTKNTDIPFVQTYVRTYIFTTCPDCSLPKCPSCFKKFF